MISYATIGTNNLPRALAFYDALLATLGARRLLEPPDHAGFTMYGVDRQSPSLVITGPYDGQPATVGNGSMIAMAMPSRGAVDRFHAQALALGAADDGAPGLRSDEGERAFYGAYFRDLDGHKFCVMRIGPADRSGEGQNR
ncbi:MAG: VOC family protein [Sphingomonas sp.]|uniref:VOC family protein n=1 Tax=Sphingomonas sp. TaxID=28214 RepID=UPI0017F38495|nr:VOC family protein [Sphingomonas sp.]MBA3667176.1 VOC family protein [Sphingomonas sp.]